MTDDTHGKLVIPVDPDKFLLPESPPEAYTAKYDRLRDVPADVLAARVVGTLIHCEGDLGKYKHTLTKFIAQLRGEYVEFKKMEDPDLAGVWVAIEAYHLVLGWAAELCAMAGAETLTETQRTRLQEIWTRVAELQTSEATE